MTVKILVSVGTTAFDSLISAIDDIDLSTIFGDSEVIFQISNEALYRPKNHISYGFSCEFLSHVDSADFVITHAGAGNVYSLLEKNKKILIIPNLDRADKHQLEIAKYMDVNNYATVCFDLSSLTIALSNLKASNPVQYLNLEPFNFTRLRQLI